MRATTRREAHQQRPKRKPAAGEQQCSVEKDRRRCPTYFLPGVSGAKGMCSMHYNRARRNNGDPGDPDPARGGPKKSVQVKVWTTPENAGRWSAAAKTAGAELSPWCEEQINAAIS